MRVFMVVKQGSDRLPVALELHRLEPVAGRDPTGRA